MNQRLPILEQTAAAIEEVGVPVLASLVDDQRFKIFVRLKRSHMQIVDLDDIMGNARLVRSYLP
jgi:hypothetical protein